MCKRLRGWQLEAEAAKPKVAKGEHQPKTQSQLANKLLGLWAHGRISGVMCRELADLAIKDGAQGDELGKIAKCGNFGSQPGNVHKQLMHTFCKKVELASSHEVLVPCKDPKSGKTTEAKAAIFLPHMIFHHLSVSYPKFFTQWCGIGTGLGGLEKGKEISNFWEKVESTKDDRLVGHPLKKGNPDWKQNTLPLWLHGDGVEFQSRDSLMVWSFGSVLAEMQSLKSHMLLATFPKSCTEEGTWDVIWTWLQWSFKALAKGQHPNVDPWGKALKKASPFYHLAGQSCGPYKATLWLIQGDHEFYSNSLKLPHWASKTPCWMCNATGTTGARSYKQLDLSKFSLVESPQEALRKAASTHPIFSLGGVTSRNVRGDLLHIVFTKGLYSHLLGGIIHYMLYYDGVGPGKKQLVSPQDRLSIIFLEVQKIYRFEKTECRLTNLRMSMVMDPKNPHSQWAKLDAKAGETKHFAPCFLQVAKKMWHKSERPEDHRMIKALEAMVSFVALCDRSKMFFSAEEYEEAWGLAKGFAKDYEILAAWASSEGRLLFNTVIKHHTFLHLAKDAVHCNPKHHWTFRSEDFVGQIAKLAHSITMGTSATRISAKLSSKYRILLHLVLTRENFGLLEDNEDDDLS